MRRAARVDANHAEIVNALRRIGAAVQDLSGVGQGCPDLLICYRGHNLLIEIKDGSKPPSARKLTPDQVRWHAKWPVPVAVVESVDQLFNQLQVHHAPSP